MGVDLLGKINNEKKDSPPKHKSSHTSKSVKGLNKQTSPKLQGYLSKFNLWSIFVVVLVVKKKATGAAEQIFIVLYFPHMSNRHNINRQDSTK